jgi:hypothetical protein
MVGLVLACPGHPRLSHEGAAKKGVDASDKRQAAWRQRIACYLPPSQVEAPRTRNRSKIKSGQRWLKAYVLAAAGHAKIVAILSHQWKNIKYRNYLSIFWAPAVVSWRFLPLRRPSPVEQCNKL